MLHRELILLCASSVAAFVTFVTEIYWYSAVMLGIVLIVDTAVSVYRYDDSLGKRIVLSSLMLGLGWFIVLTLLLNL